MSASVPVYISPPICGAGERVVSPIFGGLLLGVVVYVDPKPRRLAPNAGYRVCSASLAARTVLGDGNSVGSTVDRRRSGALRADIEGVGAVPSRAMPMAG